MIEWKESEYPHYLQSLQQKEQVFFPFSRNNIGKKTAEKKLKYASW